MSAAYFFHPQIDPGAASIQLDEANARHAVQVLRMKAGAPLVLTNGKGTVCQASIYRIGKKSCEVSILSTEQVSPDTPAVSIGLSLLKNTSRFEWFLEKATELGMAAVYPLICARTEKQQFRESRLQGILVSALVQSQQAWMPVLHPPVTLQALLTTATETQKLIAYCGAGEKQPLADRMQQGVSKLLLIGPEGDFTAAETQLALQAHFAAVSLGDHRLRSETAAVAAAAVLKLG